MRKCFSIMWLALCACAARGQQVEVRPVQAEDSSHYNNNRTAMRLIDGSGFSEMTQTHDADAGDYKMWMSLNGNPASVRFNFGSIRYIGAMKLWNFNWKGASGNDYMNRGVREYDVLVSTQAQDPGTDFNDPLKWTVLHSGLTLPMAPGVNTYTGEDAVAIGENAHWLAIRATAHHNGGYYGLSEVRFYAGQALNVQPMSVPEGAAGATSYMTFTLTSTFPLDAPVSVGYATSNMTAVAGVDYVATSGIVNMAAGATSATISVPIIGNDRFEADRTFALWLTLLSGSVPMPDVVYGTIVDDDVPDQMAMLAPTGVSVSSQYANRDAINAVYGYGMDEAAQTHDADTADGKMWQSGNNNVAGQSLRFNFGSVRRIEQMKAWNFNWAGYTDRGVNGFDVLVSALPDPGTDFNDPLKWTMLRPGLTLPRATGLPSYMGEAPVTIGASAQWVALRINSTHGSTQGVGLSEVRFWAPAAPDVLPPVLAAADSVYRFEDSIRSALHMIDGSGINEATQTHDSDAANDKMWMGNDTGSISNQSVRFNLGGIHHVDTMKIWNFNWAGYMNRGVNGYEVLVSTNAADPGTDFNDPAKWTLLLPGLTLPIAPGLPTYTGAPLVTIDEDAHWVALRFISSHGGGYGGLSEVRFYDAQGMVTVAQAIAASTMWSAADANRGSVRLIDGSGFNEATQTHTNGNPNGMMWLSGSTGEHSVRFAFNRVYYVGTMKLWNLNWSDTGSPIDYAGYGVREYDVLVSTGLTDPGTDFADPAKWTVVHSGLTLPKGPAQNGYAGEAPVTLNVDARWVAIRVLSNHGLGSRAGLSEVRFTLGQRPKGTLLIVR